MAVVSCALLSSTMAAVVAAAPASSAAPMPVPPLPALSSGLPSTAVFWRGQQATDGTTYPCVRIPAIIRPAAGVLLAFAECRHSVGDGCNPTGLKSTGPRDVCTRRSTDTGGSWSPLEVLVRNAGQDTAVWDELTKTVVLQYDGEGGVGRSNQQVLSTDMGLTYSKPAAQTGGGRLAHLQARDGACSCPRTIHTHRLDCCSSGTRVPMSRTSSGIAMTTATRTMFHRRPLATAYPSWTRRSWLSSRTVSKHGLDFTTLILACSIHFSAVDSTERAAL